MKIASGFEREIVDLSGFWYFKIDPKRKGEEENWHRASTFDWDELFVPANWNGQSTDYTG